MRRISRRLKRLLPLVALASILAVTAGYSLRPLDPGDGQAPAFAPVRGLARWDAGWYVSIAKEGYWYKGPNVQSSVAYFPGYPLTIRALAFLGVNRYYAGELLSLICGLAAVVVFSRWEKKLRARAQLPPGDTGTFALLLYPFIFYFFGVIYADGLALLLTVGAFLALEEDHPVLATALGALATFCRPIAPALVVGLLARSVELRRRAGLPIRFLDLLPAFAGLGFAAYLGFLQFTFDDAFAFAHVQSAPGWDQTPGWHTWLKVSFFKTIFPRVAPMVAVRLFGHALATFGALALCVPTWRKLGVGYGLYCLVAVALPALSSKDFHSLGRYVMAAFPLFLILGLILEERPRLRRVWLIVSTALMLAIAFEFGAGAYVA